MNVARRVVIPYRCFGPYHVARLAHARQAFAEAGMELVPMQLFHASAAHRWGNEAQLDNIVSAGLTGCRDDSIRYRDVPALLRSLAMLRPAAVFVNGWGMADAIAMHAWCRRHGVARVLVSDSTWVDKKRVGGIERLKSLIVRGCETGFAGGHPQRRYLLRLGVLEERVFLGCDVVDNRHFASARGVRRRGGRRLLTVARFEPEKNLLRAAGAFVGFAAARPANEGWHWTIVGDGSLAARLREVAAASRGTISVDRFRVYEELPAVYANADLYFQPSVSEPWGLVVNEAMASGLAVLVSEMCGCAEDLVSAEVGWTFDPHSEEGIVAGLNAAAQDFERWQQMGEAAVRRIGAWDLDRFSSGAVQAARLALSFRAG